MCGCGGRRISVQAALAQLGERQTEDLKVPGSIPGGGIFAKKDVPILEGAIGHYLMDKVLWCNG